MGSRHEAKASYSLLEVMSCLTERSAHSLSVVVSSREETSRGVREQWSVPAKISFAVRVNYVITKSISPAGEIALKSDMVKTKGNKNAFQIASLCT